MHAKWVHFNSWVYMNTMKNIILVCSSRHPITGEVNHYCCFWSPILGCSALIGRQHYDKKQTFCTTCGRFCYGTKHNFDVDTSGNKKVLPYGYLNALVLSVLWRSLWTQRTLICFRKSFSRSIFLQWYYKSSLVTKIENKLVKPKSFLNYSFW